MPIHFIPNDPLALNAIPMRRQNPRADRSAGVAGFVVRDAAPEGLHQPETQEFLFWQCREAALMALETWEKLAGPLTDWAPGVPDRKRLPVFPNAGNMLNAFYDRESLQFFEHTSDGKRTLSGASTDVVAHETGHALLDAVRPDLLDSSCPRGCKC